METEAKQEYKIVSSGVRLSAMTHIDTNAQKYAEGQGKERKKDKAE